MSNKINPTCPYCGSKIEMVDHISYKNCGDGLNSELSCYFSCPKCGARTPVVHETYPYQIGFLDTVNEIKKIAYNAAIQLAEPAARLMTLKEIKEKRLVWIEIPFSHGMEVLPDIYDFEFDGEYDFVAHSFQYESSEYNRSWRCWTAEPTKEQQKEALWK